MWVVAEIYFVAFDEELNGKKIQYACINRN